MLLIGDGAAYQIGNYSRDNGLGLLGVHAGITDWPFQVPSPKPPSPLGRSPDRRRYSLRFADWRPRPAFGSNETARIHPTLAGLQGGFSLGHRSFPDYRDDIVPISAVGRVHPISAFPRKMVKGHRIFANRFVCFGIEKLVTGDFHLSHLYLACYVSFWDIGKANPMPIGLSSSLHLNCHLPQANSRPSAGNLYNEVCGI